MNRGLFCGKTAFYVIIFTPGLLGVSGMQAKAVAGWVGGCFLAGVAIGASVAAVEHSKE